MGCLVCPFASGSLSAGLLQLFRHVILSFSSKINLLVHDLVSVVAAGHICRFYASDTWQMQTLYDSTTLIGSCSSPEQALALRVMTSQGAHDS